MGIFNRKKEHTVNECKCGTPLPENYKYDKCTACRIKSANYKRGAIGGGITIFSVLLAFIKRK